MGSLYNIYCKCNDLLNTHKEENCMMNFVRSLQLNSGMNILDVGCGYGRNMKLLQKCTEAKIEGIDINLHIVEENCKNGLCCYTTEKFKKIQHSKYDCMIFSHIIEHFTPQNLKFFLDEYLQYLKQDGHIIIATPILWRGFYWDFDHVKPYHPVGINMVFGEKDAQVQYYANCRLKLKNIWFRKTEYMVHYKRGLYIKCIWSYIWVLVNLFYKILFKFSFGCFGKTTGWMGLYQKIN